MHPKTDKRRLYQLIDMYLAGFITARVFCDEFYYCYDLELDKTHLDDLEIKLFEELDEVSSRFSEFEEDHKLDPKAFATLAALKQQIFITREALKDQWPI